jgi:orotidine-5'-phosphate decarboxylase
MARPDIRDRLIVALDVASVGDAERLVAALGETVGFYKIGYRLGYAGGLAFAEGLIGAGKKVFLDLKLHDIGNTVMEGVQSLAALGATFLTVHAYPQTMRAAVAGKGTSPLRIIAVTVLTSYDDADAREAGYARSVFELVAEKSAQACDIGIDGIVCAAIEAERVRGIIGPERLIVTPGVRPASAATGDQKRIVTPAAAIRAGVDHVVVGRPITGAADPRAAAAAIRDEIARAL